MKQKTHKILNILIALVWLTNGLFCKLLNLVPRHQIIVARILGPEHADLFIKLIGTAEILMALWVLTGIMSRLNAAVQILIVLAMNILEFVLVPDLLLWGKTNLLFAILFCLLIFCNEFVLNQKLVKTT